MKQTKEIKRHTVHNPPPALVVEPIGWIRTEMKTKFQAPHQPDHSREVRAVIELRPNIDLHKAVEDLDGFDRIWLVSWFHRNCTWKPKVLPPRGASKKRGLFATRSPHRPNAIGITAVRLFEVAGRKLVIGSCDLIDGTPILDIKPYIPTVDSFPDSSVGWLREIERSQEEEPSFELELSKPAQTQLDWLDNAGINFLDRASELLRRDPSPHRSRRIKKVAPGLFRMGCAEWRLFFSVSGRKVLIEYVQPGYHPSRLDGPGSEIIPHREEQIRFFGKWPPTGRYALRSDKPG